MRAPLLIIELLMCYLPIVILWVIAIPVTLINVVNINSKINYPVALPLALVCLGALGIIGIIRVFISIYRAKTDTAIRININLCFVAAGLLGLWLGLYTEIRYGVSTRAAIFLILPTLATIHFTYEYIVLHRSTDVTRQ
jgi:hypothetical protein